MSTVWVGTTIGIQIRWYRHLQWFVVFYDSLHSIHAGLDYIIGREWLVEAIAWSYVNGDAGFVAFGGSVARWLGGSVARWLGGSVARWLGGSAGRLTHYGSSPLEASGDY